MRRPSPALVVAVIALIVAMSGTSYAVTQLPRNSVGSTQLKTNAVTSAKIKANAVTGSKVLDGSLTASDFASGTLLTGATGATGATGPAGPTGAIGPSTSAAAWSQVTQTFVVSGPFLNLMSLGLAATSDNGSTGTITVTQASNLVVSASLTIQGVTGGSVGCKAQYSAASPVSWTDLTHQRDTLTELPSNSWATVPVTALQAVAAGTYDVRIVCTMVTGAASSLVFRRGSLTVVATGQ